MRGEEYAYQNSETFREELPPHARRRVFNPDGITLNRGITSACAEKSAIGVMHGHFHGNYLRMRGEEGFSERGYITALELPPHARRRATRKLPVMGPKGITSACAEKRPTGVSSLLPARNYLRMRGEERKSITSITGIPELPPHARRRAGLYAPFKQRNGITSACAEKSSYARNGAELYRNYLRMRGEESRKKTSTSRIRELPPHARRREALAT